MDFACDLQFFVSQQSPFRRGLVHKLAMGELGVYDLNKKNVVTYSYAADESRMTTGHTSIRICVNTFFVSFTLKVPHTSLAFQKYAALDKAKGDLMKGLVNAEALALQKCFYGVEDIEFTKDASVKQLQELFNNLKKSVLVLSEDKIIDFGSGKFTLVERMPPAITINNEDTHLAMTVYEDIGFMYEHD